MIEEAAFVPIISLVGCFVTIATIGAVAVWRRL